MQQHPIPQNVTQYQFRLVGNMTLKQFLELAGGLVIAYLIYLSNLIFIIKLPLSLLAAFIGIGTAFLSIEERPLDQWIINFFKAIYSPTLYLWKRSPSIPPIFTFSPTPQSKQPKPSSNSTPSPQSPIYSSITAQEQDQEFNSQSLKHINQLFDQLSSTPLPNIPAQSSPTPRKPSIRVRKLHSHPSTSTPSINFPSPPSPPSPSQPTPQSKQPKLSSNSTSPLQSVSSTPTTTSSFKILQPTPKIIFQTSTASTENIPNTSPTETIDISPLTPKKPNLISGIVTDNNNKLLENIIVEIVDSQGIPQRAVKTNALGQFSISTPLPKGKYFIKVDDDSLNIPAQKITINDQIIPPIHLHPNQ